MVNPYQIGKRIYLRPLETSDAAQIAPWFNHPEVRRNILRQRPMAVADESEFIKNLNQSDAELVLGIVVKESNRLIGAVGLKEIDYRNRNSAFGITIGEQTEWNKGYGQEATALMVGIAFDTLNLRRVWLHVNADNERAIRAYQKAGFVPEGVLRQHTFRDGAYVDVITMAVLVDEWRKDG